MALLLLALPASAQDGFPALYDVTGVAADDMLNMRAAPDPAAAVVGQIAPDATGIEAVEADAATGWLHVSQGERSGWAAPRFLARQPEAAITGCFGTEPFWSMAPEGDGWTYQSMGEAEAYFATGWQGPAAGRADRFGAILLPVEGTQVQGTLVFHRALCSDGMSDRLYGYSVDVILTGDHGPAQLAGCCTLQAR